MNKLYPLLFIWVLIISIEDGLSQSQVKISNAHAELRGANVNITYDIADHHSDDEFAVWIEITDSNGTPLNVRTVTGDIGNHIPGGNGKEISWSPAADHITLNVGIHVQVFASLMKPPVIHEPVKSNTIIRDISTANLVLQSIVLPGLGLSRATGKLHWIRGVAGYACIGSAIAFNRMSVNNNEAYLVESDIPISNNLFEKAVTQDNISEVLAYTAAGIWVADVIWNLVGASSLNRIVDGNSEGFSIKSYYDPGAQAPILALRFRF